MQEHPEETGNTMNEPMVNWTTVFAHLIVDT